MQKFNLMNYTTEVPVGKTIQQIEELLIRAGASKIAKDYVGNGTVGAFFFSIRTSQNIEVTFRMPCDAEKVHQFLREQGHAKQARTRKELPEKAQRIAWRILLDWTSAQLSMIKLEQVKPEQAFLPYAYDPITKQTLFEKLEKQQFLALGAGTSVSNVEEGTFVEQ